MLTILTFVNELRLLKIHKVKTYHFWEHQPLRGGFPSSF